MSYRLLEFALFAVLLVIIGANTNGLFASAMLTSVSSIKSGDWSDGTIWSDGRPPIGGDTVFISANTTVIYSKVSNEDVSQITINGILSFNPFVNTELDTGAIIVMPHGLLRIGYEHQTVSKDVTAIIKLANIPNYNFTHNHGQSNLSPVLHAHGGHIEIHGTPIQNTWTLLTQNVTSGSKIITVQDDVSDWKIGDKIVISGTNKPAIEPTCGPSGRLHKECIIESSFTSETGTIASISGNTITLQSPILYNHISKYPEQTAVGLLTRNVVITSKNPDVRQGNVHIADSRSVSDAVKSSDITPGQARISYAEFSFLGRNETGVYPLHFHQLGNGGKNSYAIGNSIHDGKNVMLRVHDTNNLLVRDNVVYSGVGNGIATESGREMNNIFDHNMVVRSQLNKISTNSADFTDKNEGNGFWINNANNMLTNNYAGNNEAWGYNIVPTNNTYYSMLKFDSNTADGNWLGGIEVSHLRADVESKFNNFVSVNGRVFNIAIANGSSNITFTNFNLHSDNADQLYDNFWNQNDISWYGMPSNIKLINGSADFIHFGYQGVGPVLLKNVTFKQFLRSTESPAETMIVIDPFPPGGQIISSNLSPMTNSTTQDEIYLMNYYGPGKHVKLIPSNVIPTDNLNYTQNSNIVSTYKGDPMQQALFNSTTLKLKVPLYFDVGRIPIYFDARKIPIYSDAGKIPLSCSTCNVDPHDYFDENGTRWSLDNRYVPNPSGYNFPREGMVDNGDGSPAAQRINGSLVQSYKTASNSLKFAANALPNGNYTVSLAFIETHSNFDRWMYVTANNQIKADYFDLVTAAGGLYHPLWKSFPVAITDGHLLIDVRGTIPVLSAVKIVPM
jgi:G8 domain/Malectin domain